ncbi:SHOCT domain-containing protein [Streptomyces sp. NPDC102473]|uniref:SHOCT domain-containing protein n=1 Tax=Streptomyces sp. NPDC102473 TaxID=3366180 RepID=UPI00382FF5E6
MDTLANSGGPGPWILFLPFIWAAVVIGVVTLPRRIVLRGRRGPWQPHGVRQGGPAGEHSPIGLLGRRFAAGEIDEDEYGRGLSVLGEPYGRYKDVPS